MIKRATTGLLWLVWSAATAQVPPPEPSASSLTQAYRTYESEFLGVAKVRFGPDGQPKGAGISAFVRKETIASQMQVAINQSAVVISAPVPNASLGDLGPFDVRTGNVPNRGCPSNCDNDCRRSAFFGSYVDPFCWAGCEAYKAGCETVKAVEQTWSSKLLGRVSVGESKIEGGRVTIQQVNVAAIAPPLDKFSLSATLSGSATGSGQVSWAPEPLVAPLCLPTMGPGKRLVRDVGIESETVSVNDSPLVVKTDGGRVLIDAQLPEVTMHVIFNMHPLGDFIEGHPESLVTCTLPVAVGLVASAFNLLPATQIDQTIPYTLPAFNNIDLGGMDLTLGGVHLTGDAVIDDLTVGIIALPLAPVTPGGHK
jgi:hypothetical protein